MFDVTKWLLSSKSSLLNLRKSNESTVYVYPGMCTGFMHFSFVGAIAANECLIFPPRPFFHIRKKICYVIVPVYLRL